AEEYQGHKAHLLVNEAVGGENDRRAKLIRFADEVAYFAAGFFDEQHARGDVPLVEAEFPEAIEATVSHAREIERRRAIAAHAMGALGEFAVILKIRAEFAVARGKAGAEQAGGECGDFGDRDFFAVEGGAFAARGSVLLVVV